MTEQQRGECHALQVRAHMLTERDILELRIPMSITVFRVSSPSFVPGSAMMSGKEGTSGFSLWPATR